MAMLIPRTMGKRILEGATQVPVIAIIGPRQSGKSTLAKELFSSYTYVDMQDTDLLDFATTDPKGFLTRYSKGTGLIIDEAQYAPMLFAQIKVEVDKNPRPGFYVLSGSQNFLLHEKISESLAGRAYFYTLLPLSIEELNSAQLLPKEKIDLIAKGFYPRVYQPNVNAADYYENYIATYVERDIRNIRNIENIAIFKKFMQLCALSLGSTLNIANLATACGIAQKTAKDWLTLLEVSFILFSLPSYHNNLGKRLTKTPKLYFYDVGLAAALLNIGPQTISTKKDLYGGLFENMMIVDLIKNLNALGVRHYVSFFRDSNQQEIDLIVEANGKTIPIEIKASESMQSDFFARLIWFCKQGNIKERPTVVYGGTENQQRSYGDVVAWNKLYSFANNMRQ